MSLYICIHTVEILMKTFRELLVNSYVIVLTLCVCVCMHVCVVCVYTEHSLIFAFFLILLCMEMESNTLLHPEVT